MATQKLLQDWLQEQRSLWDCEDAELCPKSTSGTEGFTCMGGEVQNTQIPAHAMLPVIYLLAATEQ